MRNISEKNSTLDYNFISKCDLVIKSHHLIYLQSNANRLCDQQSIVYHEYTSNIEIVKRVILPII